MTDHALQERITRSLAYMLRHQPEKFDVEVDPNGFAEIGEVVRALNERLGEPVVQEDLEAAVTSGDRQRYEIEEGRIRALYGHSIPVEPGESSKPPELLYLAVPERDVERARRYGLRGGRRRFVHLALTEDDAREVGKRAAEVYSVLTIHALDAWEEGISFYDRKSLFLAENVPTQLIEVGPTYDDGDPPRRAPERDGRDRGSHRGGRRPRSEGRSDGRSGDEARRETRAVENGGRSRRGGGRERDRGRDRDRGRGGRGDREPRRA
ncbi:MAG: RNA 2'-phosphotransferase, partial [Planctomycetota bacterium]|nr:RNA 2'-phosphotransferase [Planctomycetota bacterium]